MRGGDLLYSLCRASSVLCRSSTSRRRSPRSRPCSSAAHDRHHHDPRRGRALDGHARRTPLLSSPFLDALAGRAVWVKPECLQHTGSFKYRGARAALSALDPDTRASGVIAFSSGNHAQGVARAAQEFGVPSVIVMPADSPRLKLANTAPSGPRW